MGRPPKKDRTSKISEPLEKAVNKILKEVDTFVELEDKLKIIDRALKFEALRHKVDGDATFGAGFNEDE